MKIFCKILEHHLDEEEEELFPRFKKYFAKSTNKKIGKKYLKERKKSNSLSKREALLGLVINNRFFVDLYTIPQY
jgi:hemerythrin superfamily protein